MLGLVGLELDDTRFLLFAVEFWSFLSYTGQYIKILQTS